MRQTPQGDKPLYVLHGQIKTPPMSAQARVEAGYNLQLVQQGEMLAMPVSRPMPAVGASCHELRIGDPELGIEWRVIYCVDSDVVIVLDVFKKASRETPDRIKQACRERLSRYLRARERE